MGFVFEDFNKDDASVTIVTMSQGSKSFCSQRRSAVAFDLDFL